MKLQLMSRSGYTLPHNKKTIVKGEVFDVPGNIGQRLLLSGYFIEIKSKIIEKPKENYKSAEFFTQLEKKYVSKLPKDWTNLKILVHNGGGIGDSLIASSICAYLKKFPCTICFSTSNNAYEFLKYVREIDEVLPLVSETEYNNFDIILNVQNFLHGNDGEVIADDYYKRAYDCAGIKEDIVLPTLTTPRKSDQVKNLLNKYKGKTFVGLHAKASAEHRNWFWDGWRKVSKALHDQDVVMFGFGKKGDANGCGAIDCTRLSISEQLAILEECSIFVGVDSCFMHLAGLMKKIVIGLFGPSKPEHVANHYNAVAIQADTKCIGCRLLSPKTCKNGYSCMMGIESQQVYLTIYNAFHKKFGKSLEPFKVTVPKPRKTLDLHFLQQKPTLGVIFPHSWRGGGEVATMNIIRGLKDYFDITPIVIKDRLTPRNFIVNDLQEDFDHIKQVSYCIEEDLQDFNVILWYGMNDDLARTLSTMQNRPLSIRIVHTHYDEEGKDFTKKWGKIIDKSICVSSVIQQRIPDSEFIPNPVPKGLKKTSHFMFKKGKTIGFLGRFDDNKNIKWLVENLSALECNLLVQGVETPAITQKMLKDIAKKHGVSDKIKFLPEGKNVNKFFGSIDALAMVSKEEGFPMVVIEAGALGVPVIATRVGILPSFFKKEIKFVKSTKGGLPFLKELKLAIHNVKRSDALAFRDKVLKNCSHAKVSAQYRKVIRAEIGRLFPDSFHAKGFNFFRREGAGDVLCALALVNKYKEYFPTAPIYFETRRDLIPMVEYFMKDIVATDKRHGDAILIEPNYTRKSYQQEKHITELMGASIYELPHVDSSPKVSAKTRVGIMPYMNRNWKKRIKEWNTTNWRRLAEKLTKDGYEVGQLGSQSNHLIKGLQDWRSENILDLIEKFCDLDYILSIEGFGMHLGEALNKQIMVLVGGNTKHWFGSYPRHKHIISPVDCHCWGSISNHNIPKHCDKKCMEGIKVTDVYNEFQKMVKEKNE